jgi:hypothetical protein
MQSHGVEIGCAGKRLLMGGSRGLAHVAKSQSLRRRSESWRSDREVTWTNHDSTVAARGPHTFFCVAGLLASPRARC